MDITPVDIYFYQTNAGRCPYKEWFNSLDDSVQDLIEIRLIRVRRGLLGDSKNIGGGIWELKFDVGPGYRIYFGREGRTIIILLHAGHKKGQSNDIEKAREFWEDYLRRARK